MQMPRPDDCLEVVFPDAIAADLAAVSAIGGRAFLVGGAVRDRLLRFDTHDFDFATDLLPRQLRDVIPDLGRIDEPLGRASVARDGREVVWTTLRVESDYDERHRPRAIRFVRTVEEDATRRDFTCNAIYVDAHSGRILDPVGGRADLCRGLLRTIGDARRRLGEDPLRLLRAIRFAARLDLVMDPAIVAARDAARIETLAVERLRDELTAAWTSPGRGRALGLHDACGALAHHVAALSPGPESLARACAALDAAPHGAPGVAWAIVLLGATLDVSPEQGERLASLERELALTRRVRRQLSAIAGHVRAVAQALAGSGDAAVGIARHPDRDVIWQYANAVATSAGAAAATRAARRSIGRSRLVDGDDVVALGLPRGPRVGEALRRHEDELSRRAAADETDRAGALRILATIVRELVKAPDGSGR